MQPDVFQQNVSEWIKIMNASFKELRESYDDLLFATEEDLATLSYQYHIIKDLRRRIIRLEHDNTIKNKLLMELKQKL